VSAAAREGNGATTARDGRTSEGRRTGERDNPPSGLFSRARSFRDFDAVQWCVIHMLPCLALLQI
jgi:hypothetical protein